LERFILEANSFYDMSRFRTIPDAEGQHGREDPGAGEKMIWGSFHALFFYSNFAAHKGKL